MFPLPQSSRVLFLPSSLSFLHGIGGTLVMCLLHTVLVPRFRRWVKAQGKYKGSCIWVASFCLPNEVLHHAYRKTFLFLEFWQCRHWLSGGQCYTTEPLTFRRRFFSVAETTAPTRRLCMQPSDAQVDRPLGCCLISWVAMYSPAQGGSGVNRRDN